MKEIRITELRKTQRHAMRYVIFAVAFVLFGLLCIYIAEMVKLMFPENYIWASRGVTKTEEQYSGLDLKLFLDEQFQSTLYYFETYESGNLTERQVLNVSAKNANQQEIVFIPIENDEGGYETITMIGANDKDGYGEKKYSLSEVYEGTFCQNLLENGRIKIEPQQDLILNVAYFVQEETTEKFPVSCSNLNQMTEEEQQEIFKQLDFAIVLRGIYSDLPVKETRNLIEIIEGER